MKRFTVLDILSYEDYEYTMLSSLVKENYYRNYYRNYYINYFL